MKKGMASESPLEITAPKVQDFSKTILCFL